MPLRKPKNTTCDSTARSPEEVGLAGGARGCVPPCVSPVGVLPRGCWGGKRIHPAAPPEMLRAWVGSAWGCGWHRGAVGRAVGLWVTPWVCGSHHGAVGRTMGLWVTLWG